MNRADRLAAIDTLEIDAGDAEVGVAELPLNHYERHALVRHLDDRNAGAHRLMVASAEAAPGWGPGQMAGGRVGLRRVVARSGAGS